MTNSSHSTTSLPAVRLARLRAVSALAGLLVALVGGVVLVGWTFDIPALKSVVPGFVSMKANTALGFLLSGLALWLRLSDGWRVTSDAESDSSPVTLPATRHPFSWRAACRRLVAQISNLRYTLRRRAAQTCAGLVALVGALTLAEYLGGWNLGRDQLLFREAPGAVGTAYPGRMALSTAVSFLLAGFAAPRLGRRPDPLCRPPMAAVRCGLPHGPPPAANQLPS